MMLPRLYCSLLCLTAFAAVAHAGDLLSPRIEWRANCIWHPTNSQAQHVYFRKVFDLPETTLKCYFAGACDDAFELFVNGTKVGHAHRWDFIDFYRLGIFVAPGPNVVAIHCINAGGGGTFGAQICVETDAGEKLAFPTDASWKMSEKETPGWTAPDFDDSGWIAPKVGGPFETCGPWHRVATQPAQPNLDYARVEVMAAAVLSPSAGRGALENAEAVLRKDGVCLAASAPAGGQTPEFVIDFGENTIGYPVIEFAAAPAGGMIEIAYGESLRECLDSPSLVMPSKTNPYTEKQRADILTLDPGDSGRCISPLVKGFRYARFAIRRADEPVRIDSISLLRHCYAGPQTGKFECDDELLNRIWRMCAYSVRLCMQPESFVSDIKRERILWMGDMRPEALVAYYAFGEYGLARESLVKLAPQAVTTRFQGYRCWWGIMVSDYYRFSGDREFVLASKPELERCVESLLPYEAKAEPVTGLLHRPPECSDWCMNSRNGYVAKLQCLWAGLLDHGSELCDAAGDSGLAALWLEKAALVRGRMREMFWDEEEGAFLDYYLDNRFSRHYPQDGNALAVAFGIASEDQAKQVSAFMAQHLDTLAGSRTVWPDYPEGVPRIPTFISPYMTQFEVEAHFLAGEADAALDCIRRTWGNMLARGGTTTWEAYGLDGDTPRPGVSLCHGWSAGPGWLLPKYALGVSPLLPGFAEFEVRPMPGGLKWMQGVVPTPTGRISVRHDFSGENTRYAGKLEFSGPERCVFFVPHSGGAGARVEVNGRVVWRDGAPTEDGKPLHAALDKGSVRLVLPSGADYSVKCY